MGCGGWFIAIVIGCVALAIFGNWNRQREHEARGGKGLAPPAVVYNVGGCCILPALTVLVLVLLTAAALAIEPVGELVPVEYVRTIDGDTIVVKLLLSPSSMTQSRLRLEIIELAGKEEEARIKMEQAAEAAQEQADTLACLDRSSDEARAARELLTSAQQAFADAKDDYTAAIDGQIARLQGLRDILNFQMTPEGILEELQALNAAGVGLGDEERHVRLFAIDAPEIREGSAAAFASALFAAERLEQAEAVWLEYDAEAGRDSFGRELAWVWYVRDEAGGAGGSARDPLLLNLELLQAGHAWLYEGETSSRYRDELILQGANHEQ